jgi:hypothetical protein
MKSTLSSRVARFRSLAEEIRTSADGMTYDESRRTLISIADNYELLADQLEQILARESAKATTG